MLQETNPRTHKWTVMAAVAMGIFLATIDGSIVNIALPSLVTELQTSFAIVEWVVLAYLLTVTTLMLSIGRLADIIGKKPLYTAGFIIFTIGSLLCGLSPTIYTLIGFRVLQAVGAAMMMALGTAIITEAFPSSERGKALGISGLMVSIGVIAGPTLGGIILDRLSWHWIFFVNLPVGILGILLVLRFVPAHRPVGGQKFDFGGAVLLFFSLISLLFALTLGQEISFTNPGVPLLFVVCLILIAVFIRHELRQAEPMIDLHLFQNRLFSINLITGFLAFVCSAGTILLMPFYLEGVKGYDPRTVGLLLSVLPIALGITAPISGHLSDKYGPRPLVALGLAITLFGYYVVSTLQVDTSSFGYMLRFLPLGIGLGFFQSPNNSAIMGTAPRDRLGVASGLLSITRTLGQITGIAVMGAIWASRISANQGTTSLITGVTDAPADIQVAALNETSLVIVGIIFLALALSVYGLIQERKTSPRSVALEIDPPKEEGPNMQ